MRDDFSKSFEKMFDNAVKKIQVDQPNSSNIVQISRVEESDAPKPLTYGRFVQAPPLLPRAAEDSTIERKSKKPKRSDPSIASEEVAETQLIETFSKKNSKKMNTKESVSVTEAVVSVEATKVKKKRNKDKEQPSVSEQPVVQLDSDDVKKKNKKKEQPSVSEQLVVQLDSDDESQELVGLGSGSHSSSRMRGKMARLLRAEQEGVMHAPMKPSSNSYSKQLDAASVEPKRKRNKSG